MLFIIFFQKVDRLPIKGGIILKDKNKTQKKNKLRPGSTLKTGDKKLNGPNRPST